MSLKLSDRDAAIDAISRSARILPHSFCMSRTIELPDTRNTIWVPVMELFLTDKSYFTAKTEVLER